MKRVLKKIFLVCLCLGILLGVAVIGLDLYVTKSVDERIITSEQAAELGDVDCILVLGCGIWGDEPSPMLEDRLKRGIECYSLGAAPKLIMSGDHGREHYNEVQVMKDFAIEAGIPSEDVFMDHAGFSTYESIYRAKEVFCADNIIIVTQEYHLYRALYIAEALGVEAHGVAGDYRKYAGQQLRDLREILARVKDFGMCIFKPEPTYLGDSIPVSGNGDVTND